MRAPDAHDALGRATIDFFVFIPGDSTDSRPSKQGSAADASGPLPIAYVDPYKKNEATIWRPADLVETLVRAHFPESGRHVPALKQYDQVRLPSVNIARQHSAPSQRSILPSAFPVHSSRTGSSRRMGTQRANVRTGCKAICRERVAD